MAVLLLLAHIPAAAQNELSIAVRSRSLQPGEAVLVSLTTPADTTNVQVQAFGASWSTFKIDDTHWRALVGIDLDRRPGTYTIAAEASGSGTLRATRDLVVGPRQFRRRVLKVAPDYVNPPPDLLQRIRSEAEFMSAVYEHSSNAAAWESGFDRPVPDQANSSFGTRSVFNGQPRSPHAGTDFLSAAGTPVHAPAGGKVVCARDLFFTGNTVILDHGAGVFSMLAHLSRVDVREGQTVGRDDVIGLVGATGRVTGPHLHWALRVGPARVDPLSALAVLGADR